MASSGCGPSWPGWADRTVMGRGCSRPLLGHGPSGQLAAVRVAGWAMTDRSVARTKGQSS